VRVRVLVCACVCEKETRLQTPLVASGGNGKPEANSVQAADRTFVM